MFCNYAAGAERQAAGIQTEDIHSQAGRLRRWLQRFPLTSTVGLAADALALYSGKYR
jgi:hypothetical protein